MRIVIAPQAFKGSLTAVEAGQAIAAGVQAVYSDAEIDILPIADGGEGTVRAIIEAQNGEIVQQMATGPLGEPVPAFYGLLNGGQTAVIEVAACAGYLQVPPARRDPRITTTYGEGALIKAALDRGCRHFIIGLGTSATNDGGAGLVQALGVSLLTEEGTDIARGGAALAKLARIAVDNLDPRIGECAIEIASDVNNPLCGPRGASAIYGPQKGATPEMVQQLDAALAHYARIIERDLGMSIRDVPGAGAAGGLGAGLMTFLHATLRSGAEMVLDAVGFDERVRNADLVITAEGQIDEQTADGKTLGVVARRAKKYGHPVLAIAGNLSEGYQCAYSLGVDAVAALPTGPVTLAYAMEHAATLTSDATERALRILQVGLRMKQ